MRVLSSKIISSSIRIGAAFQAEISTLGTALDPHIPSPKLRTLQLKAKPDTFDSRFILALQTSLEQSGVASVVTLGDRSMPLKIVLEANLYGDPSDMPPIVDPGDMGPAYLFSEKLWDALNKLHSSMSRQLVVKDIGALTKSLITRPKGVGAVKAALAELLNQPDSGVSAMNTPSSDIEDLDAREQVAAWSRSRSNPSHLIRAQVQNLHDALMAIVPTPDPTSASLQLFWTALGGVCDQLPIYKSLLNPIPEDTERSLRTILLNECQKFQSVDPEVMQKLSKACYTLSSPLNPVYRSTPWDIILSSFRDFQVPRDRKRSGAQSPKSTQTSSSHKAKRKKEPEPKPPLVINLDTGKVSVWTPEA